MNAPILSTIMIHYFYINGYNCITSRILHYMLLLPDRLEIGPGFHDSMKLNVK